MSILDDMARLVNEDDYYLELTEFDDGTKTYHLVKDIGGGEALLAYQMGYKASKILQGKSNVELKERSKTAVSCGYVPNKLTGTEVIAL